MHNGECQSASTSPFNLIFMAYESFGTNRDWLKFYISTFHTLTFGKWPLLFYWNWRHWRRSGVFIVNFKQVKVSREHWPDVSEKSCFTILRKSLTSLTIVYILLSKTIVSLIFVGQTFLGIVEFVVLPMKNKEDNKLSWSLCVYGFYHKRLLLKVTYIRTFLIF